MRQRVWMAAGVVCVAVAGCGDVARVDSEGRPHGAQPPPANFPISFEPAPSGSRVRFVGHAPGQALQLGARSATLRPSVHGERALRLELAGARRGVHPDGRDRLPGVVNRYVGDDPSRWRTGIPTYGRVRYDRVWPGIDVEFHGRNDVLEYDLIVRPGADVDDVRLRLSGAERPHLDKRGRLVVPGTAGRFIQGKPHIFQRIDGKQVVVEGRYAMRGDEIGITVGDYDRSRTLIVDPTIVYSRFVGGNGADALWDIEVGADGSYVVAGASDSTDVQTEENPAGGMDAYVYKFQPNGVTAYATLLGSAADDVGYGVAMDSGGAVALAGEAGGAGFPTIDPAHPSGHGGGKDGFLVRLNTSGAVTTSTYIGGSGDDTARDVDISGAGHVYVVGETKSPNLPTFGLSSDTSLGGTTDGFMMRYLHATGGGGGASFVKGSYIGGSGDDAAARVSADRSTGTTGRDAVIVGTTDSAADFPVTGAAQGTLGGGRDAFVLYANGTTNATSWSTYHGGAGTDIGHAVALVDGKAYVTGSTESTNLPTVAAFQPARGSGVLGDAFVAIFGQETGARTLSSYLGQDGDEEARGIGVSAGSGRVWVAGTATLPCPPLSPSECFGNEQVKIWRLAPGATALHETELVNPSFDSGDPDTVHSLDTGPDGDPWIVGATSSAGYPTTPGPTGTTKGTGSDGFITRFDFDNTPPDTTIDSGPSGLVRGTAHEFAFSANEAGVTFACTVDGTPLACSSPQTVNVSGAGPHTFTVKATDGSGNVESEAATRSFDVFSTSPTQPETEITDGPSGTVGAGPRAFSFRASPSESGVSFECAYDSPTFTPCTSPRGIGTPGDGPHTFRVRLKDGGGVVDPTPAEQTFSVDSSQPDTTITSGPAGDVRGTSHTFEFSASLGGSTFTCQFDDTAPAPCTSPMTVIARAGEHTFKVHATSLRGNVDPTPAMQTFNVFSESTELPDTEIRNGPDGEVAPGTVTFGFAARPDEPGVTFQCSIDGQAMEPCVAPKSYDGLAAGPHLFRVRAVDKAGSPDATPAARAFTIAVPPPPPLPDPPTAVINGPAGNVPQGAEVAFDGSGSTGDDLRYDWDLDGDGGYEATGVRVTRRYTTPGNLVVHLLVTDRHGRTARTPRPITVATPGSGWHLQYSPALPDADDDIAFEVVRDGAPAKVTHEWNFGEGDDPDGDGKGSGGGRSTGNFVAGLRVPGAVLTEDNKAGHRYPKAGSYNLQASVPTGDGTGVIIAQSLPVGAPKSRKASEQLFAGFTLPAAVTPGEPVYVTDISRVGTGSGSRFRGPSVSMSGDRPSNTLRDSLGSQGTVEFKIDGKSCGAPCKVPFGATVPLTFTTPGRHLITMTASVKSGRARAAQLPSGLDSDRSVKPDHGIPASSTANVAMQVTVAPELCPKGGDQPIIFASISAAKKQWMTVKDGCFYVSQQGSVQPAYETSGKVVLSGTGLEIGAASFGRVVVQPTTGQIFEAHGGHLLLKAGGVHIDTRKSYVLGEPIVAKLATKLTLGKLPVTEATIKFLGDGNATADIKAKLPGLFAGETVKTSVPAVDVATAKLKHDHKIGSLPDLPLGPVTLSGLTLHYRAHDGNGDYNKPLFTAGGKVKLPGFAIDAADNFPDASVSGLRLYDDGSFKGAGAAATVDIPIPPYLTLRQFGGSFSVDPFRLEVGARADILPKFLLGLDLVHDLDACLVIIAAGKKYEDQPLCDSAKDYAEALAGLQKVCDYYGKPWCPSSPAQGGGTLADLIKRTYYWRVPPGGGHAVSLKGTGTLLNLVPFRLLVRHTSDDGLLFSGSVDKYDVLDLDMMDVTAYVRGHIASKNKWEIGAGAKLCVTFIDAGCYGGDVLLTSKGVGGCAYLPSIFLPDAGGSFTWEKQEFSPIWSSCRISKVEKKIGVDVVASAATLLRGQRRIGLGAAVEQTVELKKGVKTVVAAIGPTPEGGAPLVDLVDPRGTVISADTGQPRQDRAPGIMRSDKLATVWHFVTPKASGTYKLVARRGSIARVELGEELPKPRIVANVTDAGDGRREVEFNATLPAGQKATLYAEGRETGQPIAEITTPRAFASALQPLQAQMSTDRGSKTFRPSSPNGDVRTLVAVIENADGTPRERIVLDTFRAPKPPKPPRPGKVRVKVEKGALDIRWTPARGGGDQRVTVTLGNGTKITRSVRPTIGRFSYPDYPVTAGATISVQAMNPHTDTFGPASTAKVKKGKAPKEKPIRV